MLDTANAIQSIIDVRRGKIPAIDKNLGHWHEFTQASIRLDSSLARLIEDPALPAEITDRLTMRRDALTALSPQVDGLIDKLGVLAARFGRETVNIGVSGSARVGKSTLLQSIAGLDDNQVPTGEGLPVTAVRSRIFNSRSAPGATLRIHTYESFRQEVLRPFSDILGLGEPPATLEGFREYRYPESADDLAGWDEKHKRHTRNVQLGRLRDIQASLWSYEDLLRGPDRELKITLADLRQYVAYPTREEEEDTGGRPRRIYLAVREARIECAFPCTPVEKLGLIDLPGMGEVDPRADRRHVASLRDEIDVVLLIKRPVEGAAYWGDPDATLVDLLDEARGDLIADRRDFALIVINDDGESQARLKALQFAIAGKVNSGRERDRLTVLETVAIDPESVAKCVLDPVLDHLSHRLPRMDRQLHEGVLRESAAITAQVKSLLSDVTDDLLAVRQVVGSRDETLARQGDELHKDVAVTLGSMVARLRREARDEAENPDYLAAVQAVYDSAILWIRSGLGRGEEAWCRDALRTMIRSGGSQGFAEEEFNRVRVEVSTRFASLDDFFRRRLRELCRETAEAFAEPLGTLVPHPDADDALKRLETLISNADEPCPTIRRAIQDVLDVRVEFRYQLYPQVRSALDGLQLQQHDDESADGNVQIAVPASEACAEELFRFITGRAEQAAFMTRGALLAEAIAPGLIFHAIAEQFDDTVVRSEHSAVEFRRARPVIRRRNMAGSLRPARRNPGQGGRGGGGQRCHAGQPHRNRKRGNTMSGDIRLFKVGLIGPTKVGKTSLVTSLLTDGQRLFERTPVTFTAANAPTRSKIANHRNELNGSLLAKEFNPGALSSNEDSFMFQLLVDPGVPDAGIMLELLDFPGGWLDDSRRPPEAEARWQKCLEHIKQSSVLLVPIDATILMGAQTKAELRALPSILAIATVAEVVRAWATERAVRSGEPALLLLCPVKCESYFADNGGPPRRRIRPDEDGPGSLPGPAPGRSGRSSRSGHPVLPRRHDRLRGGETGQLGVRRQGTRQLPRYGGLLRPPARPYHGKGRRRCLRVPVPADH